MFVSTYWYQPLSSGPQTINADMMRVGYELFYCAEGRIGPSRHVNQHFIFVWIARAAMVGISALVSTTIASAPVISVLQQFLL